MVTFSFLITSFLRKRKKTCILWVFMLFLGKKNRLVFSNGSYFLFFLVDWRNEKSVFGNCFWFLVLSHMKLKGNGSESKLIFYNKIWNNVLLYLTFSYLFMHYISKKYNFYLWFRNKKRNLFSLFSKFVYNFGNIF